MAEASQTANDWHGVKCYVLIPAAGVGQRAGAQVPKQYAQLLGQTVIARTLTAFRSVPALEATLVVLAPEDDRFESLVPEFSGKGQWIARCGGATRGQTVMAGLDVLLDRGAGRADWVLVHDAARCLIQPAWIERLMQACLSDQVGGLLALPVSDTLKLAQAGRSLATIDRSDKWAAQTPQMFRIGMLRDALRLAGSQVTDEASAMEAAGHSPLLVRGNARNLKITWPDDFELAAQFLGMAAA